MHERRRMVVNPHQCRELAEGQIHSLVEAVAQHAVPQAPSAELGDPVVVQHGRVAAGAPRAQQRAVSQWIDAR